VEEVLSRFGVEKGAFEAKSGFTQRKGEAQKRKGALTFSKGEAQK
jgi:hypothetical protein